MTSSYGVAGFTDDHRAASRRHGTERVLIAYDRDNAGDKAAAAVADELMVEGVECYRIQFPQDMDANAYALRAKPASESLADRIRHAVWLGSGTSPSAAEDAGSDAGPPSHQLSVRVSGAADVVVNDPPF